MANQKIASNIHLKHNGLNNVTRTTFGSTEGVISAHSRDNKKYKVKPMPPATAAAPTTQHKQYLGGLCVFHTCLSRSLGVDGISGVITGLAIFLNTSSLPQSSDVDGTCWATIAAPIAAASSAFIVSFNAAVGKTRLSLSLNKGSRTYLLVLASAFTRGGLSRHHQSRWPRLGRRHSRLGGPVRAH